MKDFLFWIDFQDLDRQPNSLSAFCSSVSNLHHSDFESSFAFGITGMNIFRFNAFALVLHYRRLLSSYAYLTAS